MVAAFVRRPAHRHPIASIVVAILALAASEAASAAATLDLSRTDVTFGRTPQHYVTQAQPVWLANTGDAALTITGIALSGAYAGDFALGGTCVAPLSLAPGARCRLDATMNPPSKLPALRAATVSIAHDASYFPASITLSGQVDNGNPQAPFTSVPITSTPAWLDFATQAVGTTSAAQAIAVVNTGNLTFNLASFALVGGDVADFALSHACVLGTTIAPGQDCTASIAFAPLASGPRSTELEVTMTYFGVPGVTRYSITGVGSAAGGASVTPVVEYFNAGFGHYFMTAQSDEIAGLDGGAFGGAFVRTGAGFNAWNAQAAGTMPVCRFFTTPGTFGTKSSHFYTANPVECEGLKLNPNWIYEKIAFFVAVPVNGVCAAGTVPVYRMYNHGQTGAPNHRFTTSLATYQQFTTTMGWDEEGVAFCAPP